LPLSWSGQSASSNGELGRLCVPAAGIALPGKVAKFTPVTEERLRQRNIATREDALLASTNRVASSQGNANDSSLAGVRGSALTALVLIPTRPIRRSAKKTNGRLTLRSKTSRSMTLAL
jgi:hypothetical protein